MTPYNYYQDVKINKLKEKLCDVNLSITQVFDECGWITTGISPSCSSKGSA
jgi:AraC-like DNA-binding protein